MNKSVKTVLTIIGIIISILFFSAIFSDWDNFKKGVGGEPPAQEVSD